MLSKAFNLAFKEWEGLKDNPVSQSTEGTGKQ